MQVVFPLNRNELMLTHNLTSDADCCVIAKACILNNYLDYIIVIYNLKMTPNSQSVISNNRYRLVNEPREIRNAKDELAPRT